MGCLTKHIHCHFPSQSPINNPTPNTTTHSAFGDASAGTEYGDEAMGMDIGMLGASGGRLRLPAVKEQKHSA